MDDWTLPLAMRIMDESATAEEYYVFAERLAAMARRLQARAAHVGLVTLLCLALLDRHTVDGKGRCRYCRHRVNGGKDHSAGARCYRS